VQRWTVGRDDFVSVAARLTGCEPKEAGRARARRRRKSTAFPTASSSADARAVHLRTNWASEIAKRTAERAITIYPAGSLTKADQC